MKILRSIAGTSFSSAVVAGVVLASSAIILVEKTNLLAQLGIDAHQHESMETLQDLVDASIIDIADLQTVLPANINPVITGGQMIFIDDTGAEVLLADIPIEDLQNFSQSSDDTSTVVDDTHNEVRDPNLQGGGSTITTFDSIETISGTVQAATLAGHQIALRINDRDIAIRTTTDVTGSFTFGGVSVNDGDQISAYIVNGDQEGVAITTVHSGAPIDPLLIRAGEASLLSPNAPLQLSSVYVGTESEPLSLLERLDDGGIHVHGNLHIPLSTVVEIDTALITDGMTVEGTLEHMSEPLIVDGLFAVNGGTFIAGDAPILLQDSLQVTDGEFHGSSGNITIDADFIGALTVERSIFVAPSGILQLLADLQLHDADFQHNGGTFVFAGTSHSFAITGTTPPVFNDLSIELQDQSTLTITSSAPLQVDGEIRLIDGSINGGSINLAGSLIHAPDFDGGSTSLEVTSAQSDILLSAAGAVPGLTVNDPTVTVLVSHRESVPLPPHSVVEFHGPVSLQAGTFSVSDANIYFSEPVTIEGGSYLQHGGSVVFSKDTQMTAGSLYLHRGSIQVDGAYTQQLGKTTISSDITVAGDFSIYGGEVDMPRGHIEIRGITELHDGLIRFGSADAIFASGLSVYDGEILRGHGQWTLGGDLSITSGTVSLPSTVHIEQNVTVDPAATVTIDNTAFHVSGDGSTLDFGIDADIAELVMSLSAGSALTIPSTLTVDKNLLLESGILSAPLLRAKGNVAVLSAFQGGTASLALVGNDAQSLTYQTNDGFAGGIIVHKFAGPVTLAESVNIGADAQTFTVERGILDVDGFDLELQSPTAILSMGDKAVLRIDGDESVTTPVFHDDARVEYHRGLGTTVLHDWSYPNLHLGYPGNAVFTVPSSGLQVKGNLHIEAGTLTVPTTEAIHVGGNLTNANGFFSPGNGKVSFTGPYNHVDGSFDFYNLEKLAEAPGETIVFTSGTTQKVAGSLELSGNGCDLLHVRSSDPTLTFDFSAGGQVSLSSLSVESTRFSVPGGSFADCTNECVDLGNNEFIEFGTEACAAPVSLCGDGVIDTGEDCDDNNAMNNDGCSSQCTLEEGFTCSGEPTTCTAVCGDGLERGLEICDDGNTVSGDGCSDVCTEDPGFYCQGSPAVCLPICGDGNTVGSEECDDNNTDDNDGCSASCMQEEGYVCSQPDRISVCSAECGDGILAGTEQCDDGNVQIADGCSSICTIEEGYTCTGMPSACMQRCDDGFIVLPGASCDTLEILVNADVCGNGVLEKGEECDDGNADGYDHCSLDCKAASCGDGIVQHHEECDDGNTNNNDSCLNTCRNAVCGDHILNESAEQCDPPGVARPDPTSVNRELRMCAEGCVFEEAILSQPEGFIPVSEQEETEGLAPTVPDLRPVIVEGPSCGDGELASNEECDHGSLNGSGPCSVTCTLLTCGDGIVSYHLGEQCDDGNTIDNDTCTNDCQNPHEVQLLESICGDSILDAGEECDDGNLQSGDGCSDQCTVEVSLEPVEELHEAAQEIVPTEQSTEVTEPEPEAICGNGILDIGEECDDANTRSGDGCSATCSKEIQVAASTRCGDGILQEGEQCDNGDANSDSLPNACRMDCTMPVCGDAVLDTDFAEECDDGDLNSDQVADRCRTSCLLPLCGDLVVDSEEECDGGFGCTDICTFVPRSVCGNGVLEPGELCDDGNLVYDDGCSAYCLTERAQPTNNEAPPEKNVAHITGVTIADEKSMLIRFSEPIDEKEALDPKNYSVRGSPEKEIDHIEVLDSYTVRLHFKETLEEDHEYTVSVVLPVADSKAPITVRSKAERKKVVLKPSYVEEKDSIASTTHNAASERTIISVSPFNELATVENTVARIIPVSRSGGPIGNTGPAALLVIAMGAAGGIAAVRRRNK